MCKSDFSYVSKNINPSDYVEVGSHFQFFDEYGEPICSEFESDEVRDKFFNAITKGHRKCNVCNHSVKHHIIFQDKNDGSLISVGRDCAKTILETSTDDLFKNAEKKNMFARQRELKNTKLTAIYSQYPSLQEDLTTPHYIIDNIKSSLKKWCKISEKQVALVSKLANEFRAKEFNPNVKPCPTFKEKTVVGDLTVVSIKSSVVDEVRNPYTSSVRRKIQFKVVLKSKDGWAVSTNLLKVETFYIKGKTFTVEGGKYNGLTFNELEEKLSSEMLNKTLVSVSFRKVNVSKDPYFGFGTYLKYESIS